MKIHKEGWPLIIMSLVFALILGGTSFCFGAPPVLYWILTFIPGIRHLLPMLLPRP